MYLYVVVYLFSFFGFLSLAHADTLVGTIPGEAGVPLPVRQPMTFPSMFRPVLTAFNLIWY